MHLGWYGLLGMHHDRIPAPWGVGRIVFSGIVHVDLQHHRLSNSAVYVCRLA
jgi:hypothetical protein